MVRRREPSGPPDQREELSRLIALSDGVFAIVLTLLVLDLRLPDAAASTSDASLLRQLVAIYPRMFSYVLTFLVAGQYWVAHHSDFARIAGNDRRLLWMNLMFLLSVGVLPFSTNLIGSHISSLTWTVYAINMAFIGLTLAAIWGYAAATGMIETGTPPPVVDYIHWRHLLTPGLFVLSIGIARFDPGLAELSPIVLAAFYRILARLHPGGPRARDHALSRGAHGDQAWCGRVFGAWSPSFHSSASLFGASG